MAGFGYVCALVLAAVFVRAASTKLARQPSVSDGFAALNLPAPAALARVVPLTEFAIAVLLVAAPRAGGVAALCVLAVFTGVLTKAIRSGTTAGCPCFGTATAPPVSGLDLLRNSLLGAVAVATLWTPEPIAPDTGQVVSAMALCLVGAIAFTLLRRRVPARRPH